MYLDRAWARRRSSSLPGLLQQLQAARASPAEIDYQGRKMKAQLKAADRLPGEAMRPFSATTSWTAGDIALKEHGDGRASGRCRWTNLQNIGRATGQTVSMNEKESRTNDAENPRLRNIDESKMSAKTVVLNGWVQAPARFGRHVCSSICATARGIVQIVFNPDFSKEALEHRQTGPATNMCWRCNGTVVERDPETFNPNLPTGEIEVQVTEVGNSQRGEKRRRSRSRTASKSDELLRLKYRYLDLRRPEMQKTLMLRSKATKCSAISWTATASSKSKRRS